MEVLCFGVCRSVRAEIAVEGQVSKHYSPFLAVVRAKRGHTCFKGRGQRLVLMYYRVQEHEAREC